MNDLETSVFTNLFNAAYRKCFGHAMTDPVSETESKLFSNKIFDQTGLVIGAKSLKNYSLYVLHPEENEENPSIATLDTLARFVLDAPYTDEIQRKNKESHHPYWFQYKNQIFRSGKSAVTKKKYWWLLMFFVIALALILSVFFLATKNEGKEAFTDEFNSLIEDSLKNKGWVIQSKEDTYWQRRNERAGMLTLFTLRGDNWPDSLNQPGIKNIVLREINANCFTTEVHLSGFVPQQNWQQAGLLLLEDTNFIGKSVRLSLVYNDYYGGFPKSREIIVQAVVSGGKNVDKPEEITHQLVFKLDSTNEPLVRQNLLNSALRIEKLGTKFRMLYANGSMANSAFKEIASREIDIRPRFIGLFAMRGFVDSSSAIAARFNFFSYYPEKCER